MSEGKESDQEFHDSCISKSRENDKDEDDQDVQRVVSITNRGFYGSPKFSDFRRAVASVNTAANPSSDTNEGIKENKFDTSPKHHAVDMSAVDEEMDEVGIVDKISEHFSFAKQGIKGFTKDFVHEVKGLCGKTVKGEHDP